MEILIFKDVIIIINMKTIMFWGAGFIGSHLCAKLIDLGNYVICIDNLYTGTLDNIRELMSNENFEFIRHDVIEKKNRSR